MQAAGHAPNTKGISPANAGYNIARRLPLWGSKTLADVRAATCREFSAMRGMTVKAGTIRRELSVLSAVIGHWRREHGPLTSVPVVTMPGNPPARDRWLTRSEAALLLAGAIGWYRESWSDVGTRQLHRGLRRDQTSVNRYAARFILLGIYTGSRHGALLAVQWMPNTIGGWVDLERGVMHRRGQGVTETRKRQPPIRLGRRIRAHLDRWKCMDNDALSDDAGFVHVISYEGRAIQKMRKPWYRAVAFAGLERALSPHVLRHTRATWLMQNGVESWEAAGSLGMSVDILQNVYGHHHPDWQKRQRRSDGAPY